MLWSWYYLWHLTWVFCIIFHTNTYLLHHLRMNLDMLVNTGNTKLVWTAWAWYTGIMNTGYIRNQMTTIWEWIFICSVRHLEQTLFPQSWHCSSWLCGHGRNVINFFCYAPIHQLHTSGNPLYDQMLFHVCNKAYWFYLLLGL